MSLGLVLHELIAPKFGAHAVTCPYHSSMAMRIVVGESGVILTHYPFSIRLNRLG